MTRTLILLLLLGGAPLAPAAGQTGPAELADAALPTIAAKTAGMQRYAGLFTFYWDAPHGKLWLRIDTLGAEFLFVNELAHGVGSNDLGLDRGQIGDERIVEFVRSGPKILLLQPNYGFRATQGGPDARAAVREAFAQSVLWGFTVGAASGDTVLVDATDFFLHDWHHVVETLRDEHQGSYKLDPAMSAMFLPRTKDFPDNAEFEAILTYTGDDPGAHVAEVVPSPDNLTVHEHYSFVKLPDDGYAPRAFDPRAGYFDIDYLDFSAPLGEPLDRKFIIRHRLVKKDPNAALSEPVKPLVYYVDNGAPPDVRDALIEGASWWTQAFEAAGFKNAFQVRVLPDSVDPMDIRYNVIQWVDRYTRGWSYGASIVDPRTGEIIKGQVTLGALRVRQDYLIAEGLLAPYAKGQDLRTLMRRFVLARIRQLAAHETGHTLGLAHNFAASTDDRASVMDYPYPDVKIGADGTLDLSDAYATGIGAWDIQAIKYGYEQFPRGTDEHAALNALVEEGLRKGLPFLSDEAARPAGSASPIAHLWDNGADPVAELTHVMQVRAIALRNFGDHVIPIGTPVAHLEDVLVPIYLFHRYQVVAASKVLGGMGYTYAVRGDGQAPTTMIPPAEQRRALAVLLATIRPDVLALPAGLRNAIPPQPDGYARTNEDFSGSTGPTFDALAPARSAAELTVGQILNPARDDRLVEYHAEDGSCPGLDEVLDSLLDATWRAAPDTGYDGAVERSVEDVVLNDLMSLATDPRASEQVRAIASYRIDALGSFLGSRLDAVTDPVEKAHDFHAVSRIRQFEADPARFKPPAPVVLPPGDPIGEY